MILDIPMMIRLHQDILQSQYSLRPILRSQFPRSMTILRQQLIFLSFLNLASTQEALGVDLNYTDANDDVYYAFQQTGDFVYPNFIVDLEELLDNGVRVALYYGDADYICNVRYNFDISTIS